MNATDIHGNLAFQRLIAYDIQQAGVAQRARQLLQAIGAELTADDNIVEPRAAGLHGQHALHAGATAVAEDFRQRNAGSLHGGEQVGGEIDRDDARWPGFREGRA